jgi:hypothetical protein
MAQNALLNVTPELASVNGNSRSGSERGASSSQRLLVSSFGHDELQDDIIMYDRLLKLKSQSPVMC